MHITYRKGQIALLKVVERATELGWIVSLPFVESRYDLILDDGKFLRRAQVKFCDWKSVNGAVHLDLRKQTRNRGQKKTYTSDEIDVLLVFVPAIGRICWLDSTIFHEAKSVSLRFKPARNGQAANIRMVEDYFW